MNSNDTPYHFETEHPDFKALRFLLNVPKEVVKPRAILVLVPGSNSDGRLRHQTEPRPYRLSLSR